MAKKNPSPATENSTTENEKILIFDPKGYWVQLFRETAVKIAFKASKIHDKNEELLFYGRFFKSFVEKFCDFEETESEELGALLAKKLMKETSYFMIKAQINGKISEINRLNRIAPQNIAQKTEIEIRIKEHEKDLTELKKKLEALETE